MRLARIRAEGADRVALVLGEELALFDQRHQDIGYLLGPGRADLDAAGADAERSGSRIPLAGAKLLAPIPHPPKYLAIGLNTQAHIDEAIKGPPTPAQEARAARDEHLRAAFPDPRFPQMFNKQTSCVNGPFDPIWKPTGTKSFDYEGEVVLVIGRRLRRASAAEAKEAIVGYMVGNDGSVREWQTNTSQIWLGKSYETHGPTGPWVTTADEVDEGALRIRTWVNGELRQDGPFSEQLLSPVELVVLISSVCTLEPGDLLATGTPSGVGAILGKFLEVGDTVRIEVDGLGAIENEVIAEPPTA